MPPLKKRSHPLLSTLFMASCLVMSEPDANTVQIDASLATDKLTVGQTYQIDLTLTLAEGWTTSKSGIPQAFLQIDVPDSVKLEGKVLTEFRELAKNEYVREPFERLIDPGRTEIGFTLISEPDPGDSLSLNIIAYIKSEDGNDNYFIRRRLELPLHPGAKAKETDATDTAWGIHDTLVVGEMADEFTLPQYGGSSISLADYRGKKNVIITTYRAHW